MTNKLFVFPKNRSCQTNVIASPPFSGLVYRRNRVAAIYLGCSTAFDTVAHKIFLEKQFIISWIRVLSCGLKTGGRNVNKG